MLHFPRFTRNDLDRLYEFHGLHATSRLVDMYEIRGADGLTQKIIYRNHSGYGALCPRGNHLVKDMMALAEVI